MDAASATGIGVAFAALVALLGAAIGSFLNVVIYRLPHGLSLVRPASRCPSCETPIKLRHNVPVFGWLLIGGKCAACRAPVSARYPLVELAMGLVALALFHDLAGGLLTPDALAGRDFLVDVLGPFSLYLVFAAALVAVTFIDLDWFLIPDAISLPGIPLGVAATYVAGHTIGLTWQDSIIGAAAGAGVIVAVILIYGWATGRQGMGGGDWKLLGLIGAWLGWQALPFVLFAGSMQGLLIALVFRRSFAVEELPDLPNEPGADGTMAVSGGAGDGPDPGGKSFGQLAIPFGPFLSLAALEYLLFRDEIRHLLAWLAGDTGL